MKLFILISLVSAVVSNEITDERYPGFRTGNDPNNVVTKCTYWKGVEKSVCLTKGFRVDNRIMEDFRPNYHMLNSYNKLFGNAQIQPEPCFDDPDNYLIKCPALYSFELMEFDSTEGIYNWSPLTGCGVNENMCRESCNLCGEENYITATMEVEKKTNLRCLKLMHHFPFSCMEKKVVETPLPSLFLIFLSEDILNDDVFNEPDDAMCVTFNFRRRAGADCPLDTLSEISVCTQKLRLYESFFASANTVCQVPFDNFAPVNGEMRAKLDDQNYCMFNVWRKAYFVFYNEPYGTSIDEDLKGTELQIVVYRKVDHIDIDEVTIFPGNCNDQTNSLNDLDFKTGTPVDDGVFLGIKNV